MNVTVTKRWSWPFRAALVVLIAYLAAFAGVDPLGPVRRLIQAYSR